MEFDITKRCSAALREILYGKRLQNEKSFHLEIEAGSILNYLLSLPFNFVRTFHVGCTFEMRPPNFEYTSTENVNGGELYFGYSRYMHREVFASSGWFHDENGLRDLEKVSKVLSDPINYEEHLYVGWAGTYGGIGRSANVQMIFRNNSWLYVHGLDNLQKDPLRMIANADSSLFDFCNGPFKGNSLLQTQRVYAYQLAELDISVSDVVGELIKIRKPRLRQIETDEDRKIRKSYLENISIEKPE